MSMFSEAQIKKYRAQLRELSQKPLPEGSSRREAERRLTAQWRDFVPDRAIGLRLCESFPDEELIAILKEAYYRLGRAPVQNDIFCFYRTYIKHRFSIWTAALKAADLSPTLDNRTDRLPQEEYEKIHREEPAVYALLIRLSERRTELGYPPKRREFPENEALKKRLGSWGGALAAAEGLDTWQKALKEGAPLLFSSEEEAFLRELLETAGRLGRTPLKTEVREEARCRLRIRCGSWESVLLRAGLEPLEGERLEAAQRDAKLRRRAGSEALRRIPDLEPEYTEILEEIRALADKLGRAPLKEEFGAAKRRKLQERFGSWRSALYQIGLAALSRQEASKVKINIRKRQK